MGHGDGFPKSLPPTTQPADDVWGDMTSFQQATPQKPTVPQDDIWGAFGAFPEQSKAPLSGLNTKQAYYGQTASGPTQNKPGIIRRSTLDFFSGNTNDLEHSSPYRITTKAPYQAPPLPKPAWPENLHLVEKSCLTLMKMMILVILRLRLRQSPLNRNNPNH